MDPMSLIGGGVSGGAGGIDLSGGPSTAESGSGGSAGGQNFYFAPPESVQMTQTLSTPLILGAVAVGAWLLLRKK